MGGKEAGSEAGGKAIFPALRPCCILAFDSLCLCICLIYIKQEVSTGKKTAMKSRGGLPVHTPVQRIVTAHGFTVLAPCSVITGATHLVPASDPECRDKGRSRVDMQPACTGRVALIRRIS